MTSTCERTAEVVGIGNALVDVISHASDRFVAGQGLIKGSMNLIDARRALELHGQMGSGIELSGGSAANTMVGVASLGGSAAYVGKVRDDRLGEVFARDLSAAGVVPVLAPTDRGAPTGRSLILVTPDAERTFNTFLGTSVELGPDDVDDDVVAGASTVYLEGYLWDRPKPQEAMLRVARVAREAGATVSLTLSDSFCVERHRESFRVLVEAEIDLLFANVAEIAALYEVTELDHAISAAQRDVHTAAITMGPRGSLVVTSGSVIEVPAQEVPEVVDTTGAGDLYAAGFLFGVSRGRDDLSCGRLGSLAAAEVITHLGARPETPLARLAADAGLADTGLADTGLADTGLADTGLADTGLADTGLADTGLADTGLADGA